MERHVVIDVLVASFLDNCIMRVRERGMQDSTVGVAMEERELEKERERWASWGKCAICKRDSFLWGAPGLNRMFSIAARGAMKYSVLPFPPLRQCMKAAALLMQTDANLARKMQVAAHSAL